MKKAVKPEWRRPEVKQRALERMRSTPNISELAKAMGIPRRTLYSWRDKQMANLESRRPDVKTREQEFEEEIRHLKEALAERALDLDFFKGALQKIAARRQPNEEAGATASTAK